MAQELAGHVKAACLALKFLRNVEPLEYVRGGPQYEEWVKHMNALNTARVRLGMAAEYLHEDLNRFNDAVIEAALLVKNERSSRITVMTPIRPRAEIRAKLGHRENR